MVVFVVVPVCELGNDFHPPLLLDRDLDVDQEVFVKVTRVEFGVGSNDMVHCIVFPNCFFAVWAMDRDVRAWGGRCGLFCRAVLEGRVKMTV